MTGPMALTAILFATADVSIINHPHYEVHGIVDVARAECHYFLWLL